MRFSNGCWLNKTGLEASHPKDVYEFVQKPGLVDFNELRALCKEKIQALVKTEVDREPMILPVIISV